MPNEMKFQTKPKKFQRNNHGSMNEKRAAEAKEAERKQIAAEEMAKLGLGPDGKPLPKEQPKSK